MKELQEKYYIFNLDCYEHSLICFHLSRKSSNGYYDFDNSKNVWIIAVSKEIAKTEEEALKIAENELKNYNSYLNWEVFQYSILERKLYYSKDWERTLENYEYLDCVGYYLDYDECKDDLVKAVEDYLEEKKIGFEEVELVEE